jgi:hypothetical protein
MERKLQQLGVMGKLISLIFHKLKKKWRNYLGIEINNIGMSILFGN